MQIRFNVRKLKGLLWLGCLLALAFAAWSFYDIYRWKQGGQYEARSHTAIRDIFEGQQDTEKLPTRASFYPEAARTKLWLARIDGSLKPPKVDKDAIKNANPEANRKVLKRLDEVLQVNMIVWSPSASSRLIGVTYLEDQVGGGGAAAGRGPVTGATASGTKENRLHLAEGELLRGQWGEGDYLGKVLSIGKQEVRFQWGGEEVGLLPPLGASGKGTPSSEFDIPVEVDLVAAISDVPESTITLEDGSFLMGEDHLTRLRDDAQTIFEDEISVRTVTQPERAHSFIELVNVKKDSVLDTYGFQSGDKIISVNGIPMPSLTSAINWAKANSNLPTYAVVYERLGKQYTAVVHVKQ